MKFKLSDYIIDENMDARGMNNAQHAPDDQVMARIRAATLRKAGFPDVMALPPKRRAGRRLMVVLAAALVLALVVATALATTNLGERIADIFQDARGYEGWLSALGMYGEQLDSADTHNDITVRVEGAYSNDAESIVILSFEDKLKRLEDSLDYSVSVMSGERTAWSITRTGVNWQLDGKRYVLMSVDDDAGSFAGRNMKLTIGRLSPSATLIDNQRTGITLGEALDMSAPVPMPGLKRVSFLGAKEEKQGAEISAEIPEDLEDEGFVDLSLKLRTPQGEIIDNDRLGAIYNSDDDGDIRSVSLIVGFERPDRRSDWQALLDCEIVYSYYKRAKPFDDEWVLIFRAPRDDHVISSHQIDQVVNLFGWKFAIATAKVYRTSVVVDYATLESLGSLHEKYPLAITEASDSIIFEESNDPWPTFRLVDDRGEMIPGSHFAMRAVDDHDSDAPSRYQARMHYPGDEQPSIILEALNQSTGEVLLSYRLK